jgi:hypothetical protein
MLEILLELPPQTADLPLLLLSEASDSTEAERCPEFRGVEDDAGRPRASEGRGALRGSVLNDSCYNVWV